MTVYEHEPHPRIADRKLRGPAKTADQLPRGHGPIARLNARFGLLVTLAGGTMWCAYLFTLLALVSLSAAIGTHNKIIIVGQNAQAAAADRRAEDTYKDAEAVLPEAIEIQKHLQAQDAVLERLVAAATREP